MPAFIESVVCVCVSTGVRVVLRLQLLQPGGAGQPKHGTAAVQLHRRQPLSSQDVAVRPPGSCRVCLDGCVVLDFWPRYVDVVFVDVVTTVTENSACPEDVGDVLLPGPSCLLSPGLH